MSGRVPHAKYISEPTKFRYGISFILFSVGSALLRFSQVGNGDECLLFGTCCAYCFSMSPTYFGLIQCDLSFVLGYLDPLTPARQSHVRDLEYFGAPACTSMVRVMLMIAPPWASA